MQPDEVNVEIRYSYQGESVRALMEGETDALMFWDPYLVPLERDGAIRILTHDPYHLEVVALSAFLEQRPEVAERFMVALLQAMHWVLVNPERAAGWYEQISGVPVEDVMGAMEWAEPVGHFREHPGLEGVRIASTEQHLADVRGVIGAMGGYGVFDDLRPRIPTPAGCLAPGYPHAGPAERAAPHRSLPTAPPGSGPPTLYTESGRPTRGLSSGRSPAVPGRRRVLQR